MYVLNRHTKVATDKYKPYKFKKYALEKLIKDGHGEKIGLQKYHNGISALVRVGNYLFHTPPTLADIKTLPYLPFELHRNPKVTDLSVEQSRQILINFIGERQEFLQKPAYMVSDYLSLPK